MIETNSDLARGVDQSSGSLFLSGSLFVCAAEGTTSDRDPRSGSLFRPGDGWGPFRGPPKREPRLGGLFSAVFSAKTPGNHQGTTWEPLGNHPPKPSKTRGKLRFPQKGTTKGTTQGTAKARLSGAIVGFSRETAGNRGGNHLGNHPGKAAKRAVPSKGNHLGNHLQKEGTTPGTTLLRTPLRGVDQSSGSLRFPHPVSKKGTTWRSA